jgi:hypothetical protein
MTSSPPAGGALRAVKRSGECASTHRGAEPPEGHGATSAARNSAQRLAILRSTHGSTFEFPRLIDLLEAAIDLSPQSKGIELAP